MNKHRKNVIILSLACTPIIVLYFCIDKKSATVQEKANFPTENWLQYANPEDAGWSSKKLKIVENKFHQSNAASVMVIYDGIVLTAWGDIYRRYKCHSIRKSFLSALYGIHVSKGSIDLNCTLEDLNIDDEPPLGISEKQARVIHLLKSRSGIFHAAAYEGDGAKPERGTYAPDSYFLYNNWDFNTLCTIFEQETNTKIFDDFYKRIALPLQMQDFRLLDTYYHFEKEKSIHPAYRFRMSTRDLARFGYLYLKNGKWMDKQIIQKKWIRESTTSYSEDGYGYMWWVRQKSSRNSTAMYIALGAGGHSIIIIPEEKLIYVHRTNTYKSKYSNSFEFLDLIRGAKFSQPRQNPKLIPLAKKPIRTDLIKLNSDKFMKYVNIFVNETEQETYINITRENDYLIMEIPQQGIFKLLPISLTHFIIEDYEIPVYFHIDNNGKADQITIKFSKQKKYFGNSVFH